MPVIKLLNVRVGRGLLGAALAAIGSAALVPVLSFGYLLCRWAVAKTTMFDREYDLNDVLSWLPRTTLVITVFAACAGWAAYAPAKIYSFARTLITVVVGSIGLGGIISLFELTPRRYKGIEHPFLYSSEAMLLFGIPLIVALALTLIRVGKPWANSTEPLYGPDSQEREP